MALKLPATISTRNQLTNALRNLEEVLEKSTQNAIRHEEGVDFVDRPDVSSGLAAIVRENKLEVSIDNLKNIAIWLNELKKKAPIVRFTFASEPKAEVVTKLVHWLREESQRFVLVRVGIQPSIAAGCIVHTPSHRYDFSLRSHLENSQEVFINVMSKADDPQPRVPAAAQGAAQ